MSASISSWLATYAMHSTLFLGTAWLVTSRISFGAQARETMWKMALVGGVMTASLPAIGPLGTFTLRWPATESVVEAADPVVGEVELFVLPLASAEQVLAAVPKTTIGDPPPIAQAKGVDSTFDGVPWSIGLVGSWLAIAFGLGLVKRRQRRRFQRDMGVRTPVADSTAVALFDRVRHAAGTRPVRLSSSSTLASPVALGGREICVPERALEELDRPLLEALFAHELAHIERRDPEWLIAVSAFESAFFFQPLNWVAGQAIRTAAEEECDRAAVELVGEGRALARCLVEVASWVRRARPVAVAGMAEPGTKLEQRVARLITAGDLVWPGGSRRIAALTTGALAIAIACGGPKVRPTEESSPVPSIALEGQAVEDGDVDRVAPEDRDVRVGAQRQTDDEEDDEAPKRSQRTREYVWIGPGDDPEFQFDVVVPPFEHLAEQLEGIEEWARGLEPLELGEGHEFRLPDIEIMKDLEELKEFGFAFQTPGGGGLDFLSTLGDHLRIQIRGDVEFEDGQVKSISPDGRLEVDDDRGEIDRRIEVTASRDGELIYEYQVDGEPHAFDDAGREWLAGIIEMVEKAEYRAVPGRVRIRRYDGDDEKIEHDIELRGPDRKEIEKRIRIHRRQLDDHRRELNEKLREIEPRIERELEDTEQHIRHRLEMLEEEVERLRQQLNELEQDSEEGS